MKFIVLLAAVASIILSTVSFAGTQANGNTACQQPSFLQDGIYIDEVASKPRAECLALIISNPRTLELAIEMKGGPCGGQWHAQCKPEKGSYVCAYVNEAGLVDPSPGMKIYSESAFEITVGNVTQLFRKK